MLLWLFLDKPKSKYDGCKDEGYRFTPVRDRVDNCPHCQFKQEGGTCQFLYQAEPRIYNSMAGINDSPGASCCWSGDLGCGRHPPVRWLADESHLVNTGRAEGGAMVR